MSSIEIRAFERRDREQLTELVNAHVDVVVPGRSVSVNAVLSQLEREPGEVLVDPWVTERTTLVAVRREQAGPPPVDRLEVRRRVGDKLRLGEVRMLLAEHEADNEAAGAFLRAVGFRELTRTERGWSRTS